MCSWSNKWSDGKPSLEAKDTIDINDLNRGKEWLKEQDKIQSIPNCDLIWLEDGRVIKTLTITNDNKQYTFTAEIIGDLALNFTPDGLNAGWNIYHVPTLACFSKAVSGFYLLNDRGSPQYTESFEYSREALLTWMDKVQKNYTESVDINPVEIKHAWHTLRLLTPDNYSDSGQSAKDIILKWCLSVPIVEE